MATLGYSWTTIGSGSYTNNGATLTYYIEAKLNSQSVDNNQSVCDTRARTVFSGYSMTSYNVHMSCTGCAPYDGNNSTIYSFGTRTVLTGSVPINHNANGTGSLSMRGACTGNLGMNIHPSGSIDLPTIPRNSSITVFNNFTIEDGFSFTYKDELASKTLTLTCKISDTSILTKTYTSSVGSHTDSITFTAAQLTTIYGAVASNSKTAEFTLSLSTSGITTASTATATGTLKASVNSPSVSGVTISETGSISSAGVADNQVMRYLSKKVLRASASAQHGATVSSVRVVNDQVSANMTYNSSVGKYVSTEMSNLVTGAFVVTVTDSRGFTASTTLTCDVLDYTYPTITNVVFDRTSNIQDSGYVQATGTFWNKRVNETTPASVTLSAGIVITGGGTTVTRTVSYTGIPSTTSLSWNIEALFADGTLLRNQTYTCTVTVTDQYGQTATYTVQLGLAKRALWLGKYTIKAEGIVGEHWIGLYKVGDIFLTLNTENPADRFGGTWQLISTGRFLLGSDSTVDSETGEIDTETGTYKAGDTGGESTVTLDTSQIPAHTHDVTGTATELAYGLFAYNRSPQQGNYNPAATSWQASNSNMHIDTLTARSTGGSLAHNNMPPYLVCYIWQKTA